MADYISLPDEKVNRDYLLRRQDFVEDMHLFHADRNNEFYPSNEEAFDAYLEHLRKSAVDERQAVNDLNYAQDSVTDAKQRFSNLYHVFDRIESFEGKGFLSERGMQAANDYLEGIGQSPSTWIATIISGGLGLRKGKPPKKKRGLGRVIESAESTYEGVAASLARIQALGFSTRQMLARGLKATVPAIAVEIPSGALQGAAQQQTKTELGLAPPNTWQEEAAMGAALAIPGALVEGGVPAAMAAMKSKKLLKMLQEGEARQALRTVDAKEETAKILADTTPKTKRTVAWAETQIRKLDEAQVNAGIRIKNEIGPSGEELVAGLSRQTIDGIKAAAVELAQKVGFNSGDPTARITERVAEAIRKGSVNTSDLRNIALKYNLSMEDLSHVFMAEVSEAARTLRTARTIKGQSREAIERSTKKYERFQDTLRSVSPISSEEIAEISRIGNVSKGLRKWFGGVGKTALNLNKMRLLFMTSQITTTIRNAENVGLRLPLHMIEYVATGPLKDFPQRVADATRMGFDLFDKASGDAFAYAFKQAVGNKKFQSVFRSAMDVEVEAGSKSTLANIGRAMNVFNTFVDNTVKRTVFLGEIRKIAGGTNELNKIVSGAHPKYKGGLKQFLLENEEPLQDAIKETLSLVYQKGYSKQGDTLAERATAHTIDAIANSPAAPLLTSVIPFPRYLANQTEFIYKHFPLVGLVSPLLRTMAGPGSKMALKKGEMQKRIAQQISGLAMLGTTYQLKLSQGPEVPWNHYADDKGRTRDITALLGPFASTMFITEIIYRMSEGNNKYAVPIIKSVEDVKTNLLKIDWKEAFRAFSGIQGRVGTGLYIVDRGMQDFAAWAQDINSDNVTKSKDAVNKFIAAFAANYINTFTVPVGMFRDLQATFDPEGRKIMDHDRVDLGRYMLNQMLRTMPNTQAVRNTEEFFGITEEHKGSDLLQYLRGEQRPQKSPYATKEMKRFRPLERQFSGVSYLYDKEGAPTLASELNILGFARQDFIRRYGTPLMNNEYKKQMALQVEKYLIPFIMKNEYQNMSIQGRRLAFKKRLEGVKQLAKENAKKVARSVKPNEVARWEFTSLGTVEKAAIEKAYKDKTGVSVHTDENYTKAMKLKGTSLQ